MTEYNRTDAALQLLDDIQQWCARTATPQNSVGHVLFRHPGFVGLLRKRLTVSTFKETEVRQFMAEHPNGWRGVLPKTHSDGIFGIGRKAAGIMVDREDRTNAPAPVDRDPCARCGVRHDIGCHHTRQPIGMTF